MDGFQVSSLQKRIQTSELHVYGSCVRESEWQVKSQKGTWFELNSLHLQVKKKLKISSAHGFCSCFWFLITMLDPQKTFF